MSNDWQIGSNSEACITAMEARIEDMGIVPLVLDNTTISLAQQAQDTVAWIMKWGSEIADESAKMIEKLERLEGSLKVVAKVYAEQYHQDYSNIQGMITNIGYGMTEGLNPDTVDLQALFAGLQNVELSSEDIAFFRSLQSQFMEKSPETQAHMLWFFELISNYVVSKSQDLSIQTNPLKKILFSENTASYKEWISLICNTFENDAPKIISLANLIEKAEAPTPSFPLKTIRDFYKTNPEMFEKDDYGWLTRYYVDYPDLVLLANLNKTDPKVQELVKQHSAMNLRYKERFLTKGTTSPEAIQQVQDFRDSLGWEFLSWYIRKFNQIKQAQKAQ